MPIGGFNAGTWNSAVPAGSESVGLGENRIQSVKTTLQQAVDSEHFWDASGGTIGVHRAGSARAFYGTESQVSTSGLTSITSYHEGRLMATSDTTRLFSVGPSGKGMLGAGPKSLSLDSNGPAGYGIVGENQITYWAMEVGVTPMATGTGEIAVTFPNSGFSGMPYLQTSVYTQHQNGAGDVSRTFKLFGLTPSGFTGQIVDSTNNVGVTNAGIMWQSVGTRSLRS